MLQPCCEDLIGSADMATVGRPSGSRDDDDISAGVIASAVASLAIAAVAIAARFYTRAVIMRGLAAEDWFVLAAWVGTTSLCGRGEQVPSLGLTMRRSFFR